ncbi:heavy-metal-associated domain-containing protein [Clostridium cylindrosporum]|uniref:HMA domain-containing protein n=1 Tax=Clostridium cylindrosporum DSM 605 TaxID=1121307 RepID=A0A0J8D639_CLOCY|nr:heavy-metal-associated domain-containing protein [Clostridium cylindrosporum]KMT21560.1 hypothetical protein CLCY_2c03220 [Clostridium cylindrosporum DSM 605]
MKKKIFIEGMTCNKCSMHVKEALEEFDSVMFSEIDLEEKSAIIHASSKIDNESIIDKIYRLGYSVVSIEEM